MISILIRLKENILDIIKKIFFVETTEIAMFGVEYHAKVCWCLF